MPNSEPAKLPFGIKGNKTTFIIAGFVVIGGVIYFRHKANQSNTSTTTATGTGTQTDPAGNVGQIDPATGYAYGSPEDTATLNNTQIGAGLDAYGTGAIDPNTGVPYAYELGYGSGDAGTGTISGQQPITTNSQWLTAAEGVLPNGTSATVEAALSKVLGGVAVSASERDLFLEAVGILGNPPQGYPQPIKLTNTSGQPGASIPAKPAGLHLTVSGTSVHASWSGVSGATQYLFQLTPHDAASRSVGTAKSVTTSGLKKGTTYKAHVAAQNGSGKSAWATASIKVP